MGISPEAVRAALRRNRIRRFYRIYWGGEPTTLLPFDEVFRVWLSRKPMTPLKEIIIENLKDEWVNVETPAFKIQVLFAQGELIVTSPAGELKKSEGDRQ